MKFKILGIGILTACTLALQAFAYNDVAPSDWYYSYLESLTEKNIISGYEDGTFRPESNITVGEVLKVVLATIEEEPIDSTNAHWAEGYLLKASELGIDNVTNVDELSSAATREYVAQLIMEILNVDTFSILSPFVDADSEMFDTLFVLGIIEGELVDNERYFHPDEPISRAEISAIITRTIDIISKNESITKYSADHPTVTVPQTPLTVEDFEAVLLNMLVNYNHSTIIKYENYSMIELTQVHDIYKKIDSAFHNVYDTYHEYFSFGNFAKYLVSQTQNGSELNISLYVPEFETSELVVMREKFFSDTENIVHALRLSGQIHDDMTQMQIAETFYHFVAYYNKYDESLKPVSFTGYGITENNEAVCQGYVALYNTMCKIMGIEIEGVTGTVQIDQHIWSRAVLDGVTYYIDPTFADPVPDVKESSDSTYFAMTEEEIRRTHEFEY